MDAWGEGGDVRVVVGGRLKSGEVGDDGVKTGGPCCRGGVVEGREVVCIGIDGISVVSNEGIGMGRNRTTMKLLRRKDGAGHLLARGGFSLGLGLV